MCVCVPNLFKNSAIFKMLREMDSMYSRFSQSFLMASCMTWLLMIFVLCGGEMRLVLFDCLLESFFVFVFSVIVGVFVF